MHAFYLGSILGVVLAVGDFREGGIPRDVEGDGVGKRRKGIAVYLWKKKKCSYYPVFRTRICCNPNSAFFSMRIWLVTKAKYKSELRTPSCKNKFRLKFFPVRAQFWHFWFRD
jgi:hypothetical protein